jgi:hypothetical protein
MSPFGQRSAHLILRPMPGSHATNSIRFRAIAGNQSRSCDSASAPSCVTSRPREWTTRCGRRSCNCCEPGRCLASCLLGSSPSWPGCPGHLLRLNPRARLSPSFCFVGSPGSFRTKPKLSAGPANKALQLVWERGRLLFRLPPNNGQQKRRTSNVYEPAHNYRLFRKYYSRAGTGPW